MDRKRLKKLMSILTAMAIIAMSFTGTFSVAAEELDVISENDVIEAILYNHADGAETPEDVVGGNDYDVTASQNEEGKIEVAITATDVKLHENEDDKLGYWVGFAVKAPDGATHAEGTFAGVTYADESVTVIDENGNEGIAFYINAGALNPKTEATVTWFNGETAVSEEATFVVDLSGVTLDIDYYTPVVTTARIVDAANPDRTVYTDDDETDEYVYTAKLQEDGKTVKIAVKKLALHKNGNDTPGFWTGFAVVAPDGADFAKYTFGEETDTENVTDIDGDAGDKIGIAFYTDAANPNTEVKLQWFDGTVDGENNALSSPVELTMNLDGVEYYKVDADNDVTKAILFDNSEEEPKTTLYDADSYSVIATQGESAINVAIAAENVVKHENDRNEEGYWVGFAVVAPEGATEAKGTFGTPYEEAVTDIDGNGIEGIAFYINAGDAEPKTEATLQWLDESGETLCAETSFNIDLSGVSLGIDYTPVIGEAKVVDQDNNSVNPYNSYSVAAAANEEGVIVVDIDMADLKSHLSNGEGEGYWTGFAVEAPEGADKMKYAFGTSADLALSELVSVEENVIDTKNGIAFYANMEDAEPNRYAKLQWYNGTEAVSNVMTFEMNLDNVKLNWIKSEDVSKAVLDDTADVVETLYTSHSIGKQQTDETITVKVLTKDLEVHQNADVDISKRTGYWTGFAVNVPAEATHIKYTFDKESDVEWSSATTIPVEENVVDGKFSLYTNAGATEPKLYAQLQWLKDGAPLCAPTKFVIDISGVTLADLPYIMADDVKAAKIVDQDNNSVNPYNSYSVAAAANEEGVIVVNIDMTALKSHLSNGAGEGYWTGFAVVAPDDAATMRYAFAADKESLSMNKENVETGVATVDEVEKNGVAFYTNAGSSPKKYVRLQWFDENGVALTNATDFEMDLTGVQLYSAPVNNPRGGGSSSNYYTVKFDTNGGNTVASVRVKKEAAISAPAAPFKEGYAFEGWYTDKELTQKYDFSAVVTKSFTLYAKWIESENGGLKFTDVKKDAWYYDVVKTVAEKGLMNGISETEFAPELDVTRGMFVTILYRAAGEPEIETAASFEDVAAEQYYANAVAWASANGVVNGITETEFAPDNNITREQMAAILFRFAKTVNADTAAADAITYTDKDSVSDYAEDAIAWAKASGIMEGNEDGTFAPARNATRAEAAAVFVRLLDFLK